MSVGDAAKDDEAEEDGSPRAPTIAAMTRADDRVAMLPVLAHCMSRLQSTLPDVASTYVFFDTPTICSGAWQRANVRVLIVEDEPYTAEAIRDYYVWSDRRRHRRATATPLWCC